MKMMRNVGISLVMILFSETIALIKVETILKSFKVS